MSVEQEQKDREAQFLKELAELTTKHGISIGGCGCCGSPWLATLGLPERVGHYEESASTGQIVWMPKK